jgi:hypothetical protein
VENSRGLANQKMWTIENHCAELMRKLDLNEKDALSQRLGYYMAVLRMVRNEPLSDEKAQSILESKLSQRIHITKNQAVRAEAF